MTRDEEIEAARALLKPTKVRLHHVPRFFLKVKIVSNWGHGYHGFPGATWLDHYGSTKLADGRTAFVSEPYHVTAGDLAECTAIADHIGCTFWVSANSWWCPGSTIRLCFAPVVPS